MEAFKWGGHAQEAFDVTKKKMTREPALRLPDFSQEFAVESDV